MGSAAPRNLRTLLLAVLMVTLGACDLFTDSATRLAYDIERSIGRLGGQEGDELYIVHRPKFKTPDGNGRVKVQLDKVGALIVWYSTSDGTTLESGSTSFHSRFIDTPATWIVEHAEGEVFTIRVQRRGGRAVVVSVD